VGRFCGNAEALPLAFSSRPQPGPAALSACRFTGSFRGRRRALAAHARAVAGHVSVLAKRDYPSKIKDAINFTVCFVPADDLISVASKERPELFYEALRQRILIATPTTLVALMWGVAYGWQQDARARQARQIGDVAAELHERFGILMQHLNKTGRSLNTAVNEYNALVGALDSRVLPQMRKLEDLGILVPGARLPEAQAIQAQTRPDPVNPVLTGSDSLT
jgi:DNA recombination protein RmuC